MKIKETIGIDISKETIDVCIHSTQLFSMFKNTKKGFEAMIKWVYKNSSFLKDDIVFIFEHTGLYSEPLSDYLSKKNISFSMISGLEIKRSLGISRGKDDKIDAAKIALYGYRLKEELSLCKAPTQRIRRLKKLLSLRERLVKQRAGYKASLKEQKKILKRIENELVFKIQEKMVVTLSKQIKLIELQMERLIKDDIDLHQMFVLITSIRSVGTQTALYLIVYTEGFTKFKDPRKFASYCGIAPFPNKSGTSIRGKTRVSHLANKKIKSLLDLCAKSSIRYNTELREYYYKRVDLGKNKMSTINIMRNKLVTRIFAVIKRGTPYVDCLKYAS